MTDRKSRIAYLVNIKEYLRRLAVITGRDVKREDLEAVENVDQRRSHLKYTVTKYELSFNDFNLEILDDFINRLYQLNSSSIYVWIQGADDCGLLRLPSIKSIDFSFVFAPDLIQIITFTTTDLEDNLLLDIDLDENNLPMLLTIKCQGKNWSQDFTELAQRVITD